MFSRDTFLVGGQFARARGTEFFDVISPSTEEVIGRLPAAVHADVDAAAAAARHAFDEGPWPRMTLEERVEVVQRIIPLLRARLDELVSLQVSEMGSPVRFMGPLTDAVINELIGTFIESAQAVSWEYMRERNGSAALVVREPVGVVGAVTPWNGPVLLLLFKLLPAVLTGCTVVIKPAPESPLDAYVIAEELQKVGFPEGVVSIIPAGREIGEYLISHPLLDKVAFTGSTAAGRRIGAICGEHITRVTLELGGKSAAIILDDADLDHSLPILRDGAMANNGQICSAITRFLVPRDRYREFADRLCQMVAAMKVGDPFDENTEIGPLVAQRQRTRVEDYIASGRTEGAKVLVGGGRPAGLARGWYVEPTVFGDVSNDMRIAREEIFGPVVALIPYSDDAEAVKIANDSPYGLSGAVFTRNHERGLRIARQIRTGTYTVDGFNLDLTVPFGGYKCSGIGRECGPEGMEAYLEYKSIGLPQGFVPVRL
jgi:aldehyde dehydrogenase (NAD+)